MFIDPESRHRRNILSPFLSFLRLNVKALEASTTNTFRCYIRERNEDVTAQPKCSTTVLDVSTSKENRAEVEQDGRDGRVSVRCVVCFLRSLKLFFSSTEEYNENKEASPFPGMKIVFAEIKISSAAAMSATVDEEPAW
jgi:hypothetical protein